MKNVFVGIYGRCRRKPAMQKSTRYNIKQHIGFLVNEGFWDRAALSAYKKEIMKRIRRIHGDVEKEVSHICRECFYEAKQIGSPLYEKMFRASRLPARIKAELPIRQMGGFLDEHHMLQLGKVRYETDPENNRIISVKMKAEGQIKGNGAAKNGGFCFWERMDPNGHFPKMYASAVVAAYGKKGLDNRMVHQFRMYLDLHNILYIRKYFDGETDLEKLLNYEKQSGKPLDYSSDSRFHNRVEKVMGNAYTEQFNDKIKSHNGLSEFIVKIRTDEYGEKGEFVSQWNHLRVDQTTGLIDSDPTHYTKAEYKNIVETESFNYCKNDRVMIKRRLGYHTRLDVAPAGGAAGYENDVKLEGKKYWVVAKDYKEIYKRRYVVLERI